MFFNEKRQPMRIAVISAHPDDETLGAGGTIAKHSAFGDQINVCIVTSAYTPDWPEEPIRIIRDQATEALNILGVKDITFLGFPTVKLNTIPEKNLNDKIADYIKATDPQVIYAPFPGDLNSDHSIVARATAIAARPIPETKRSLLYFETLSSTEWGRIFLSNNFKPNVYVDISSTLESKLEAASSYDLELKNFPHPRSLDGIETLAKLRGIEVGVGAAEAFSLALHIS